MAGRAAIPVPHRFGLAAAIAAAAAADLFARHQPRILRIRRPPSLGLGVSFAPFPVVAKSTRYYREECAHYGWEPTPEQMLYRANILLAETDEEAQELLGKAAQGIGTVSRCGLACATRCLSSTPAMSPARRGRPPVGGVLPTSFYGGPDTVVEQIKRCRKEVGVGVLDLISRTPAPRIPGRLMQSLELFAEKVLPRIREM